MLPDYAELFAFTNFSFLRGASHGEELVQRAAQLGYSGLAITDECSLAGVVRAHVEAKKEKLQLVIGSYFQLVHADRSSAFGLILLAQNREGYGNLSELITLGRMRAAKGEYLLTPHDISKPGKGYPIGYFHIDIAEVQTAEGELYLFVAIDRTSKFSFTELHRQAGKLEAAQFLHNLIKAVPYRLHTVLTDNGIQFANRARDRYAFEHIFGRTCRENGIEHRLTKVKHPWTNGQVERMNRTIKEATVKRYHYETHSQLETHLHDFIQAYNFARRLKTLKGLTPYEYICQISTAEPERFILDPLHQMPGLNI